MSSISHVEAPNITRGGSAGGDKSIPNIQHEQSQRIAGKDDVADNLGHVRRRVARNMQRDRRDVANRKSVAIVEEPVKFRAVARELGSDVEDLSKHVLDRDDLAPNGELPAQL